MATTGRAWRQLDTHVITGYQVPPNYDSMVAKLLVHQPTRTRSIRSDASGVA
ncbi:MAG: hypothetical protein U0792_14285 [Gemmataceae bacterium]